MTYDAENPPNNAILVTTTLTPGLAPLLNGLEGIVAETGSVLSHLAILAREAGVATVVGYTGATSDLPGALAEVSPARRLADIVLAADSRLIAGTVPSGRTLSAMLSAFELHEPDRQALVSAVQRVFDVRHLRDGQPFKLDRLFDGRVRSFEYEIDGDRRAVERFLRLFPLPEPAEPSAA